jgi:hypothetical protein
MTPFTLFLYALSVAAGVLIIGFALLVILSCWCFLLGSPSREKPRT